MRFYSTWYIITSRLGVLIKRSGFYTYTHTYVTSDAVILDKYHLVCRFASNTRVIVNASSNPFISQVKLMGQNLKLNHQININ